ncbi:MAG: hypothetical protein ACYTFP_05510 [Planctomycetota bacterium]|jgi:hypothetical protein
MDRKFEQIISLLCVLVISGLTVADCGTCGAGAKHEHKEEKKACSSDCQKACCATQTAPDFTLNLKEKQLFWNGPTMTARS